MNTLLKKDTQSGMTYMGMLLVLVIFAFFAVVLVRIVPLYLENFKVQSVLKSLHEDAEIAQLPAAEIEKRLFTRLDINDVERVKKEHMKISREKGKLVVAINYEARVPLFLNLDLVAKFDDAMELVLP